MSDADPFADGAIFSEEGRRRIASIVFEKYGGLRLHPNDPLFLMFGLFERMQRQNSERWMRELEERLETRIGQAIENMGRVVDRCEKHLLPMLREVFVGIEAKGYQVKAGIEKELSSAVAGKLAEMIAAEVRKLLEVS